MIEAKVLEEVDKLVLEAFFMRKSESLSRKV
jgi:hypothetical protein